jgi:hypothetical protein
MRKINPRRSLLRLAAPLALALAAPGCFQLEAEVPDIEVTQRNLEFEGVAAPPGTEGSITLPPYPIDLDKLPIDASSIEQVLAREVVVSATRGATSLDFISDLRVTIAGKDGKAVELATYERKPGASVGAKISMKLDPQVDITGPVHAGEPELTIALAGALPPDAWSVDVNVKLGAKAKVSYTVGQK